jgi:hypothetical protein
MRKLSWTACLVSGFLVAGVTGAAITGMPGLTSADTPAAVAKNQLSVEALGTMLSAIGLKAERTESRYDFQFSSKIGEEWQLSMSAVLSNDNSSIWIMAWLDECPKNAADVPRQALLRLLADNDSLGGGKFFAFIASNRRFTLQRVMENKDITSAGMRAALTDLAKTVVDTYPHWNTGNWKTMTAPSGSEGDAATGAATADTKGADAKGAGAAPATPATAAPSASKTPATKSAAAPATKAAVKK